MGRKRRPRTIVRRIRASDSKKIEQLAREAGMSFQQYLSKMMRKLPYRK